MHWKRRKALVQMEEWTRGHADLVLIQRSELAHACTGGGCGGGRELGGGRGGGPRAGDKP